MERKLEEYRASLKEVSFQEATRLVQMRQAELQRQLEDDLRSFMEAWVQKHVAKARGQHMSLADAPQVIPLIY